MQKTKRKIASLKRTSVKTKHDTSEANPLRIIVSCIAIGIAVMMISALALAFALSKFADPDSFLLPASLVVSILCGLGCGVCAAKISERPVPYCIICGIAMVLIYFAVSLVFDPADLPTDMLFKTATVAILPLSAVAGGFFTSKNKRKK